MVYGYWPYVFTFAVSFIVAGVLTPLVRRMAIRYEFLDEPDSHVKTHKEPIPHLGGIAIFAGWGVSLILVRLFTSFPTGTLYSLRGIVFGVLLILALGLFDDLAPKGLGFKTKLLVQILAALLLVLFDIRIHFVSPHFMAVALTVVWIVGLTNAFNIIDIMDGLSSGIAVIASLAFLFIALPSEQIYVNFCSAALAGGLLGFMPYNLSRKRKIFMGDTGSLTIGFLLASVSLGASYTKINYIGLFAPLLILAVPIYDTFLVMILRWRKGLSPFIGSKDHFALRLEKKGLKRNQILIFTFMVSIVLAISAYLITRLPAAWATGLFLFIAVIAVLFGYWLSRVKID